MRAELALVNHRGQAVVENTFNPSTQEAHTFDSSNWDLMLLILEHERLKPLNPAPGRLKPLIPPHGRITLLNQTL